MKLLLTDINALTLNTQEAAPPTAVAAANFTDQIHLLLKLKSSYLNQDADLNNYSSENQSDFKALPTASNSPPANAWQEFLTQQRIQISTDAATITPNSPALASVDDGRLPSLEIGNDLPLVNLEEIGVELPIDGKSLPEVTPALPVKPVIDSDPDVEVGLRVQSDNPAAPVKPGAPSPWDTPSVPESRVLSNRLPAAGETVTKPALEAVQETVVAAVTKAVTAVTGKLESIPAQTIPAPAAAVAVTAPKKVASDAAEPITPPKIQISVARLESPRPAPAADVETPINRPIPDSPTGLKLAAAHGSDEKANLEIPPQARQRSPVVALQDITASDRPPQLGTQPPKLAALVNPVVPIPERERVNDNRVGTQPPATTTGPVDIAASMPSSGRSVLPAMAVYESLAVTPASIEFTPTVMVPMSPPNTSALNLANPPPLPIEVLPLTRSAEPAVWGSELGERVSWMLNQKQNSATIRLDPPHLGKLDIQLRVTDDATTITIQTQHVQTRELIESASTRLRDFLQENGYQNVNVDVSQRQDQRQPGSRMTAQAELDSQDAADLEQSEQADDRGQANYFSGAGLLDIFA